MKQRMLKGSVLLLAAAVLLPACKDGMKGDAFISFRLSSDYSNFYTSGQEPYARSGTDGTRMPDTNNFILTVTGADGEPVYSGPYGERPDPMQVRAGSYDLSLRSVEFEEPAFATPLFGDDQAVTLESGQTLSVAFGCSQYNCGLRLIFSDSFISKFSGSDIVVSSGEHSLNYPFDESRTAFFMPGILRVSAERDGEGTQLLSRQLNAADMLTLKLSVPDGQDGDSFSVDLDTARNWIFEDFVLGSGNSGASAGEALSVEDLPLNSGAKGVWVAGYIVGGDVTISKVNFEAPFKEASNLAISADVNASAREDCAPVQLPQGKVREALSLVDHPELVGRKLYIKGDIETYFGSPGVKNVKEFQLE